MEEGKVMVGYSTVKDFKSFWRMVTTNTFNDEKDLEIVLDNIK